MYYTSFTSYKFQFILAGDEKGLSNLSISLITNEKPVEIQDNWIKNDCFFSDAKQQIIEFFSYQRKGFNLPLNPKGTEFQKCVWNALQDIPAGMLKSYKDIAVAIQNPKACRSVGMANNKNPLPLIIPCHRVIGSNGDLVGYGGGLDIKETLIEFEKGFDEANSLLKLRKNILLPSVGY